MKTITLRDDVYRKLASLKGRRSFSDVIDELIRRDIEGRVERIIESSLRSGPSDRLEEIVETLRKELKARKAQP